ncbi:hypothetical protein GCM10023306_17650 [Novosphingobium ginsenosidimutans]
MHRQGAMLESKAGKLLFAPTGKLPRLLKENEVPVVGDRNQYEQDRDCSLNSDNGDAIGVIM